MESYANADLDVENSIVGECNITVGPFREL
jgi:hypothetical protein